MVTPADVLIELCVHRSPVREQLWEGAADWHHSGMPLGCLSCLPPPPCSPVMACAFFAQGHASIPHTDTHAPTSQLSLLLPHLPTPLQGLRTFEQVDEYEALHEARRKKGALCLLRLLRCWACRSAPLTLPTWQAAWWQFPAPNSHLAWLLSPPVLHHPDPCRAQRHRRRCRRRPSETRLARLGWTRAH